MSSRQNWRKSPSMSKLRVFSTKKLIAAGLLEIGDGYRAKNSEMGETGLPFIRAGDVNLRVNTIGTDILSLESVKNVGHKKSKLGDVVITTKGTVGRVAFVDEGDPEFVYSPQLCYWRSKDHGKISPRWLFYALQSNEMKHQMGWSAGQTDMAPYISLTDQRTAFHLTLPPIKEQISSSSVLAVLDQKIDLNRRMNETLEAMAQAIFKDWFVDFGPTRAKTEGREPYLAREIWDLFPDALGDEDKPVGWEYSEIGNEVGVVGGATPSTKEAAYWEGGENYWATPKDLSRLSFPVLLNTNRKITDSGVVKISSGILPIGTVLLSSRAPIGYLAISEVPVSVNQGFIAMVCKKRLSNVFVLFWCHENLDYIKSISSGSTFAEISKKTFRPIPVIVPSEPVLTTYEKLVRPLYERIVANVRESSTLAQTRDLLLPKLMSGEIRLRDAEKDVEVVA